MVFPSCAGTWRSADPGSGHGWGKRKSQHLYWSWVTSKSMQDIVCQGQDLRWFFQQVEVRTAEGRCFLWHCTIKWGLGTSTVRVVSLQVWSAVKSSALHQKSLYEVTSFLPTAANFLLYGQAHLLHCLSCCRFAHAKMVGDGLEVVGSWELPDGDDHTFLHSKGCPYVNTLLLKGGCLYEGRLTQPEVLLPLLVVPGSQDNEIVLHGQNCCCSLQMVPKHPSLYDIHYSVIFVDHIAVGRLVQEAELKNACPYGPAVGCSRDHPPPSCPAW